MHQHGGWGRPSLRTFERPSAKNGGWPECERPKGLQGRPSSSQSQEGVLCIISQHQGGSSPLGLVGQHFSDGTCQSRTSTDTAHTYSVHGALLGDPHRFERSRNRNRQTPRKHPGFKGNERGQGVDRGQGTGLCRHLSRLTRCSPIPAALSASPSPHFGPQSNLVSRFLTLNWS